jgi:hypothetical protein
MSFRTPSAGEGPARVALGSVTATVRACRAYRIPEQTDFKKQAQKLRMNAAAFDRQAQFANEECQPATAARARAEATRLRALADSMEADAAVGARALCVNRA